MGIESLLEINRITKDEYHRIDYKVMRFAYDIHNEFGRLYNEGVYRNELAKRCEQAGFGVRVESKISVRHKDFKKSYYLDLVINDAIIYELKTAERLSLGHKSQLLNYLMLMECNYGKLINLRPTSVEHEFVTTSVGHNDRFAYKFDVGAWSVCNEQSAQFEALINSLVGNWGVFLSVNLFIEALVYFLGGEEKVLHAVDIISDGVVVGRQKVKLLSYNTAFEITAFTKGIDSYKKQLVKFIKHTSLTHIQWVNFNRQQISFVTITNT